GFLWPSSQAAAQDDAQSDAKTEQEDAAKCLFTKADAVEANGGPLGASIWGRLCQVKDGKAAYPEGAEITVLLDGEVVGTDTTGADGAYVVPIPANGTYVVQLDIETLPDGFSLTNEDLATLSNLKINLGDQQAVFRLGEDTRGQRTFSDYATTVIKGLRLGLILAVAAIGLSLVYGVTGLVNFAHAELVTIGAMFAYLFDRMGIPFWLTIPLAMGVGAAAGLFNDVGLWRPLRKRRMALLSMMVVSIGLSTAARNIIQVIFGPNGRRYSQASGQLERSYGPFRLTPNDLIIMVICVVVLVGMTIMLRRTRLGTAIRAVADNADLAASSGIAVDRVITMVWIICGTLAALGGVLYGLSVNVRFDTGFILLLSMFAAVVLGGLGNAYGAILGAIVIGVAQETSGLLVDTAYKFAIALFVLILVLLVRPQGILGQPERFG
ncbi:MAG: hypothetical protein ABI239_13135, partial [Aquihabitans sp.]